jgi:hypothetical protein
VRARSSTAVFGRLWLGSRAWTSERMSGHGSDGPNGPANSGTANEGWLSEGLRTMLERTGERAMAPATADGPEDWWTF